MTALRDRLAARYTFERDDLVRVTDEHAPEYGMTGRVTYVAADWLVATMTCWGTTRTFQPWQLTRIRRAEAA